MTVRSCVVVLTVLVIIWLGASALQIGLTASRAVVTTLAGS